MNALKTGILLTALTALALWIGRMVGGMSGMVWAFGIAIVMNVGSYWFSDRIVLAMYRARPITEADSPELYSIVSRLTGQAGLPMPRLYVVPGESPNAFATGRNPQHAAVAVTEGLLRILDRDEVEGVLAHELAHVKNRDILIGTIAATFAGAIMMIGSMARWAAILGTGRDNDRGGAIGMLALAVVAPIAAILIQMAISRSREYQADATGASISGKPLGLANALIKLESASKIIPAHASPATAHMMIVNPLHGGIGSLLSTHPAIPERVRRLREMADRVGQ